MTSRFTSTNRLSNVIEMVKLSKQSGILRVTRGQPQREIGQIRFIAGEPISALLGSLTGGTALSALSNWGECMYAFEEVAPESEQNYPSLPQAPQQPQMPPPTFGNSSPPPPSLSSWPSYGYPSTNSLNSLSPLPDFGSSSDGSNPGYYDNRQPIAPGYSYPGTMDPYAPPSGYAGVNSVATSSAPQALRPEQLMSRPRRTSLSEQVDQLPLDRRERMVLLLVDGQRTVSDLVGLTRRSDVELYSVLNHLRILGLVLL